MKNYKIVILCLLMAAFTILVLTSCNSCKTIENDTTEQNGGGTSGTPKVTGSGSTGETDPETDPDPKGAPNYTRDIMTFKSNGNVGIGTSEPAYRLHVTGGNSALYNNVYLPNGRLGIGTTSPQKQLHVVGDTYLSGNVGIGTTNPEGYKLRVNGKINCTDVVVTAIARGEDDDEWPDYVFAEDYNLRTLDEVASYIQENKRLPEIPSATEVAENGVNLLEINKLLLKKVEELTLYILQQDEKMTNMQGQIDELKKR